MKILSKSDAPLEFTPSDKHFDLFSGSLIMPPCTEGIRWQVMKESAAPAQE